MMSNSTLCNNINQQLETFLDEYWRNRTLQTTQDIYDDSSNSYKYIVFVLIVYAVSFMALMVKYFHKSTTSTALVTGGIITKEENLYDEFVKRDSFR